MIDNLLVKKEEFRWSFRKKGAQVLNICTRLLLLYGFSFGLSTAALANPVDGVVTGGAATITNTPAELQINQTSNRAIIDWKSFDIAAGETTHFYQPSSSAVALNRVVNSTQLSSINGNLLANGHVFIINPNGVLIGGGAHVDTAGFIASSADIADAAFMGSGGTYEFNIPGNPNAIVENRGHITVQDEGLAAFVAPVVRNSGVIEGNLAKIQLGAGDTFGVDLYGDGLIHLAVAAPQGTSARKISAENSGSIVTEGGKVLMTAAAAGDLVNSAINNSGVIQARGMVTRNGEVILTGGGADVAVSGSIDVSGANGGGTVKIGGDAQGKGALEKANTVKIADDAVISANATGSGNGGSIVVWSEANTTSTGSFYAKAGANGGNGGLVETSSKGVLDVAGTTVDATAPSGELGLWLLDPTTLTVDAALAATISSSLADVSLVTSDGMTFAANISVLKVGGINISATAGDGGINIDNNYIRTNGGDLTFNTTGAVSVNNSTIYTRGGDVSLTGDTVTVNTSAAISTSGGNVDIIATSTGGGNTVSINSSRIDTSGGSKAGGIDLLKLDGSAHVTGTDADKADFFGNTQNHFDSSKSGGKITIKGKKVAGNNDCFSAGGSLTCSAVSDPIPSIKLAVAADAQSKVYGSADPALTYAYTGTLQGTDAFTGALARAAGNNVGSYAINQGTLTVNGGYYTYTITYTGNTLAITPYELTVAANAQSKVYGSNDPALSYSLGSTALQYTDALSGGLTRAAGNDVGTYAIGQGTLAAGGNYTITYTGNTLAITPYELTVAANAQSKVYGSNDPALSYSLGSTALQYTDALSGGLTRAAGNDVGTYAIGQGTLAAGGNYTITYTGNTLAITPYELTVAANAQSKVYGSNDPALSYSLGSTALQYTDALSGGLTRAAGNDVGTYAIGQGTLAAGGNYTITYTGNTLAITPYELTVAANAQSKVYGSNDPALSYSLGSTALQYTDALSGGLTRAAGNDVGTYAIGQGTLAAGGNYTITYTGNTLAITPYELTVAANAQSKVYGSNDPALSYSLGSTALQYTDALSGGLTRAAGNDVGTYAIGQGTLAAGGNYTITYTGNTLAITPYELTVAANAQSKVYGSNDPALSYSLGSTALQYTDALSGGLTRAAGNDVGTYAIGQGTLAAGGNYTITYTGNTLAITPYELTVAANAQSKVYGSNDPALSYSLGSTALQYTDALSGGLTRAAGNDVGTYAIGQGTLAAGGNYTITYTGNTLAITPYELTVAANAQSKVYGSNDPALSYSLGSTALQYTDALSGGLTRAAGNDVGTYAIGQGTLAAGGNYTITYTGNTLAITPYELTVAANAQSKVYGSNDPALSYSLGSTALQYTDALSGGLTRAAGNDVGTYAIGQGTLAAGGNYTITYTGNTLAITPYELTVAANAQSKVYGSNDPALSYSLGSTALQYTDALSGGLTRAAGNDVGTYAIGQGTLAAGGNYTITYTGNTLAITPYELTVAANAQSKVYGSNDPALSYSLGSTALQYTDALSGGLTRAAGNDVGTYAIGQGTLAAGGNYTITYTGNTLAITPYELTVAANAQSKVYGSNDPALSYSLGSTALQYTDALSGGLTRAAGNDVGTYAIGQGTLAAGGNYTITYTGNTLAITPYELTVAANAQSKVYGSNDPALSYSLGSTALQYTDALSGGLTRAAGNDVGTYAIGQGTLAAGGNYTITYTGNTLAITPYELTVAANAQSKVYGSNDPALSYSLGSTALQYTDALSGGLTRAAGNDVGTYAIGQGTLAAGGNYTITYTGNTLAITPYELTVAANAQSKVYGSNDPALSYSLGSTALQYTDALSGGLTRAAGNDVGTYAIGQGTLAAGGNYTITYTGNTLAITPYELTVAANAQSKVYGSNDPALSYSLGSTALQYTDALSGGLTRAAGNDVGTYAIGQGTLAAGGNYTITYTGNTLAITPYELTVAANAQSKVYGSNDPALSYSLGSTALQYTDALSGGLTRAAGNDVGTYAIGQGTLAAGGNYTIVYTGNVLTITPLPVPVPNTRVASLGPITGIDSLGRPIISIANQAIVLDSPFERIETLTLDTDVSIRFVPVEPDHGSASDLAGIEPAAGGDTGSGGVQNDDTPCVNAFLDGKDCKLQ